MKRNHEGDSNTSLNWFQCFQHFPAIKRHPNTVPLSIKAFLWTIWEPNSSYSLRNRHLWEHRKTTWIHHAVDKMDPRLPKRSGLEKSSSIPALLEKCWSTLFSASEQFRGLGSNIPVLLKHPPLLRSELFCGNFRSKRCSFIGIVVERIYFLLLRQSVSQSVSHLPHS